jgi:starch synthase
LKDTVEDYDAEKQTGTGFMVRRHDPLALLETVERGLALYGDDPAWTALRRRGMAMDFSWDRSAKVYSSLYQRLVS